jgi:hypothetical protein
MATGHAGDDAGSEEETSRDHDRGRDRERRGVGPIALLWYGGLFGIGAMISLAGAANAVGWYTGEVYAEVPAAYLGIAALLLCTGSVLLLYGVYGTVRTAIREA